MSIFNVIRKTFLKLGAAALVLMLILATTGYGAERIALLIGNQSCAEGGLVWQKADSKRASWFVWY